MSQHNPQTTTAALLVDLRNWTRDSGSFHGDRQLADRVLLATDWRCVPDPAHSAGVKWEFGVNPVYTSWEPGQPHPINSLDDAMGQLPFRWRVWQMTQIDIDGDWHVQAIGQDGVYAVGYHNHLPVAVSIAAVAAWEIVRNGD